MITNIKDLANVKVGEIVNITINVKDLNDNIVPMIGTIKCSKTYNLLAPCKQCAFDNTMDCAYNKICYSKGGPDRKSVYFELAKPSSTKNN